MGLIFSCSSFAGEIRFESVNAGLQLKTYPETFQAYYALWRGFDQRELKQLREAGGDLLSARQVSWNIRDCTTRESVGRGREKFFYWDSIKLDPNGQVIPINEAYREGHRYFVVLNLNSWPMRAGGGPTQGTFGSVTVHLTLSLRVRNPVDSGEFVTLQNYQDPTPEMTELLERYHPERWPVFYDERSHKPHSLKPPRAWADGKGHVSDDYLGLRLVWDWCGDAPAPTFRAYVPAKTPIAPGPNRFQREKDSRTVVVPSTPSKNWQKEF